MQSHRRCRIPCQALLQLSQNEAELGPPVRVHYACLLRQSGADLLRRALAPALARLPERQRAELLGWAARPALADLELDARDARSYTLKTFGCAVWAFRQLHAASRAAAPPDGAAFIRATLTALVMEGGDADTTAAAAGACLGARVGYAGLPADWLAALPHRAWLEREIETWYVTEK